MKSGGFIYAIGLAGRPLVKIGKTVGPVPKRLAMLQTGQPEPLTLLASVQVEQHLSRIEKTIHQFLAAERQRGEWFVLDMDQGRLEALILRAAQVLQDEETRIGDRTEERLGDRLARIRGFRQLSQQEVAERTGLKVQNISRIETDQREHVRSDTLRRLAEALDCSTDYLLGLTDDPQPVKRRRRKTDDTGNLFPTLAATA